MSGMICERRSDKTEREGLQEHIEACYDGKETVALTERQEGQLPSW